MDEKVQAIFEACCEDPPDGGLAETLKTLVAAMDQNTAGLRQVHEAIERIPEQVAKALAAST